MIQRGTTKKSHRNRSIRLPNELLRAFRQDFRKSLNQNWLIERILVFGFVLHFFTSAQPVQALELSYGGRLTSPSGEPLSGPLDLTFRFYRDAAGGSALATVPVPSISLMDGVFQTSLNLSAEELDRLFEDGDQTVFVEVETQGKVYPRQKFSYVPLALRVPVDGSKITYDSDGRLTINSGALSASASLPGATGTGGLEKVGDQTYSTYSLSAAGKALVGAVDLAAQKSILGLGILDGVTSSVQTQLNNKLSFSGGTMTGALDMGGSYKITNLADPTSSGDATRKSYVDGKLGGQTLVVGTPAPGQVIKWDGSKFALATDEMGVAGGGIASLNGLTSGSQSLAVETPGVTSGTRPAWTADSGTSTHMLTIPLASASGVTAGLLSKTDYDLFSGKQSTITTSSALETGSMTTNLQSALEIKPYGSSGGQTGEIRIRELTASGVNYVGLKAPDTLGTNTIWTLPQGDGPNGHVLSTDGSGTLSWISPSSGSVTSIVPGTGLTGGPISSAGTISLANVGTAGTYTKVTTNAQGQVISGGSLSEGDIPNLSASKITSGTLAVAQGGTGSATAQPFFVLAGPGVGPTAGAPSFRTLVPADIPSLDASKITSGTLANSLINWAAAPVTTVAGRTGTVTLSNTDISGLGSLATANAVSGGSSGTITDDSITNADINSAAAISDTKLATIATAGKVANSATTATSANTNSAIVARDASGNFSAGTITAALNGNATNVTGTVAVSNGGTGASTATAARANLGLGTAATLDVGTAANNVLQLDGTAKLPAVDGSQLSGVVKTAGNNTLTGNLTLPLDGLVAGSNQLILSGGNVGIGTTAPTEILHIHGNSIMRNLVHSTGTSGYAEFRGMTDAGDFKLGTSGSAWGGATYLWTMGAKALTLGTGNAEKMRLDANGNVGIGTTSPTSILQTLMTSGYSLPATSGTAQSGVHLRLTSQPGATLDFGTETSGKQWIQSTNSGNLSLNYPLLLNPNGGAVGIGTSNPALNLAVRGSWGSPATTGTTQTGAVRIESSGSNGNVLDIGGYTASPFGLWLQGTERNALGTTYPIILQPNGGNVGIGTTTPAATLDINGSANISSGLGTIIYSSLPNNRFSVPSNGYYYTGESLTITVPSGPNRRYRLVLRESVYNAAITQVFVDISTSSTTDNMMYRLHRIIPSAGWESLTGETYVTLAGGTTTSYFIWVTYSNANSGQVANAVGDNRTFSDFYAVPM